MRLAPASLLSALLAAVALTGCGGAAPPGAGPTTAAAPPPPPPTELVVDVWPEGVGHGTAARRRLRCSPPAGEAPDPVAACRLLERDGRRLLAPLAPGSICTAIYGGADVARVRGVLEGRPVDASFRRSDGCEIARWDALEVLLGRGRGVGGPVDG